MNIVTASLYWVVVAIWLSVLATAIIFYVRNPQAFGTTRLLLAVVGIDTLRNIVENSYFGVYFGGQYGVFSPAVTEVLGRPHFLILPKLLNIAAGVAVLGVLLLKWLPHAIRERALADLRVEHLSELAETDSMTEVWNRRHFLAMGNVEVRRARRYGRALTLALIDLDNLKAVNDRFGHGVGDMVIVDLANICRAEKRASDMIGRIGGDEFAMLLPETSLAEATSFAERLRNAVLHHPVEVGRDEITTTVSIGLTDLHASDLTAEELLRRADVALYRAKLGGRNQVQSAGLAETLDMLHPRDIGAPEPPLRPASRGNA